MSNMAAYARIFETGTSDEWVEKRKNAASELRKWFEALSPQDAIKTASAIATSLGNGSSLPEEISTIGEEKIQKQASSFVRSADQGELQIKVVMSAVAIDIVSEVPTGRGWTAADALAAAFWSALSFQHPLEQSKIEKLRQDLLAASSARVLLVADAARTRHSVPSIGPVNIDQDSAPGAKVNQAFSRAVAPMVTAMCDNAALDREELDFLWWLLSDRSYILNEPFAGMSDVVRAVAAGFDAAAKLRRLPGDAHRNIVLRNVADGEAVSLAQLLEKLGERRAIIAASLGAPMTDAPAVFPLMTAIATGSSDAAFAARELSPREWGARALLEGALHHLQPGAAGGL
jgi:hypothetical protein